ncbi:MAG: adenosylcobalamin-dependent ribonucleoside-diphosphate reductase [archaeon]
MHDLLRKNLPHIALTENQSKVIKDKYLKDSPSPEAWFELVATNIALGDVLHHPNTREDDLFKNVRHKPVTYNVRGRTWTYHLLHVDSNEHNERDRNFKHYLTNLAAVAAKDDTIEEAMGKTRDAFYKILSNFEFLPNSPTLMNAGRALQQLSACYVLPVPDSIEGIYTSVLHMAIIHKSGGGTGFSFSNLRPEHDEVKSTKGVSSGPISFMQIFDKSTDVVKQGGTRRGANMGILRYDHPDILKFITMKKTPGMMENFNVSVAIDDNFMQKVKRNEKYDLINPHTNEVSGQLNAKEVFDLMVKSAWETGDPGIIIIDRINNSDSNPTPALGSIESTNPCGEQPLLPYEPCNLGSINLSKFVRKDGKNFDYERLGKTVKLSVHFLDNVIDVNNYPLPRIEELAKGNRRIGLGVMGWAESLVLLGLPYNSTAALKKAEEVMQFIDDTALEYSCELALERGPFPNFVGSTYDKESTHYRGKDALLRHSTRTTIAPTGTIGITAGLQGAGIEPFFAIVYTRYNAAGLDALKTGKTPDEKDVFYEVNPLFKEIAEKHGYFGLPEQELFKKVDANHKSLLGLKEIPEAIQRLFLTSHDLEPLEHVAVQVAFQKHTNNAVSKTVNLRNEATVKDVEDVYWKAYEWGAKGVTIYRDGSKQFQVLNIVKKEEKKEEKPQRRKSTGLGELSMYYKINTGQGSLHIHINYDEQGPTKLFANISPSGTEISGMTTALGIMISKYLECGGDAREILRHLNSIKGDKPYGMGPNRVDSIAHGLSKALRDHLIKTGKLIDLNGQSALGQQKLVEKKKDEEDNLYCPKCFSPNVTVQSGCTKPTCFDCGYSECS